MIMFVQYILCYTLLSYIINDSNNNYVMGDVITTATASTYFSSAYGFQPPFDDVDVHGTYTMMMEFTMRCYHNEFTMHSYK